MADQISMQYQYRPESDFELEVELKDHYVCRAWSKNIRMHTLETILPGRGALDGLVFTPRLNGVYGTAHLLAAVQALEMICGVTPPENATWVRTLALMVEHIQSDLRQSVLVFMKDYLNPVYANQPFYAEAQRRYQPFQGKSVVETLRMTKKLLEIIAVVGGQWPNSAFMVPGGISGKPSYNDLVTCRYILSHFQKWYEERILGCSLDRWQQVQSEADLQRWMNEKETHFFNELGVFIRFAHLAKLHDYGKTVGSCISFPLMQQRDRKKLGGHEKLAILSEPVFLTHEATLPIDHAGIGQYVASTFCKDYPGCRHPFEGETVTSLQPYDSSKYSFDKAPRYNDQPAETGPLAEMLALGNPLFVDLVRRRGCNAYVRSLARLVRPAILLPIMQELVNQINSRDSYYTPVRGMPDGQGYGLISASKGALGHWLAVENECISHYQVVSPEIWNRSPRDQHGISGPCEDAVLGTKIDDPDNPVELYHIIRSFDCCHSCSVHVRK